MGRLRVAIRRALDLRFFVTTIVLAGICGAVALFLSARLHSWPTACMIGGIGWLLLTACHLDNRVGMILLEDEDHDSDRSQ